MGSRARCATMRQHHPSSTSSCRGGTTASRYRRLRSVGVEYLCARSSRRPYSAVVSRRERRTGRQPGEPTADQPAWTPGRYGVSKSSHAIDGEPWAISIRHHMYPFKREVPASRPSFDQQALQKAAFDLTGVLSALASLRLNRVLRLQHHCRVLSSLARPHVLGELRQHQIDTVNFALTKPR